jgi:hypothetical protein
MERERLESLSVDELWALREEVDARLTAILIARRSMLEERLEQLQLPFEGETNGRKNRSVSE